jgi:hypothetical protein
MSISRIGELKRIEALGDELLHQLSLVNFYEGKEDDIDRVRKLIIKAKLERLELELIK